MKTKAKGYIWLMAGLSALLLLLATAGVFIGGARLGLREALLALAGKAGGTAGTVIRRIRVPRVLGAALCGAMLALSGTVFQSVFRNPMTDPYLLGISSGATLAIALGSTAGLAGGFLPSVPVLAFAGALAASAVAMSISRNNQRTLILTGIALSGLFSALTTLLLYLNRRELVNVIFWTMGSFSLMSPPKVALMALAALVCFLAVGRRARAMDLLLLDEGSARSLGLDVERERRLLLLAGTFCAASAVCFCGVIGFAGLLAPHIARMLAGREHRRLVPAAALVGAIVMLLSDTAARTVLGSAELPVGVVTSLLGAPLFISLAARKGEML